MCNRTAERLRLDVVGEAAPAVDLTNEAVQQLVARYSFAANAAVIRAEDKMMKSLFDLKV